MQHSLPESPGHVETLPTRAGVVWVAFLVKLGAMAANVWLVRRQTELLELGGKTGDSETGTTGPMGLPPQGTS